MSHETLNIVVPMAGRGSRFADAGYKLAKPLLPVHGQRMIELVIANLRPSRPHRFIFICQQEHLANHDLTASFQAAGANTEIIPIDYVTEGPASTVLLARQFIDDENPLMIANCDQYISTSIDKYLAQMTAGGYDGYIMTMAASDPKWSYIGHDSSGSVSQVVEKRVISSEATVGIYNYRNGCDFVSSCLAMMEANDRANNEFYVAPAYNYMIAKGKKVGFMNIGAERDGMYGLGVPADLEYFNSLDALPVR